MYSKVEMFLIIYYKYVLFPIALALLLFGSWGFINNPSAFMVQKLDCYGNYIDCEPTTASITFFGATITDNIIIPVVDEQEFAERQAKYDRINFYILLCFALIVLGFLNKYKEKLKKAYYNDNK